MPPDPQYAVEQATLAVLQQAGKAGTPAGEVLLVLARRLDGSTGELGSSLASLAREFRAALAEVTRDVRPVANPLDELRVARERRAAG